MPCTRGCCDSFAEHVRSIGFRPAMPGPKETVDHTDTAVVTTTEHWHDRQDVTVAMRAPAPARPTGDAS